MLRIKSVYEMCRWELKGCEWLVGVIGYSILLEYTFELNCFIWFNLFEMLCYKLLFEVQITLKIFFNKKEN